MLLPLLLSAAMLTQTDINALRSSKLSPNATNNISTIALARGAILARATFSTYTNISGGQVSVMSTTIPAGALQPGDHLRYSLGGTAINNTGANDTVGAFMQVTQGNSIQFLGRVAFIATGANAVAWRSEGLIGVSIPGATGQYVKALSSAAQPTAFSPRNKLPNSSIAFAGYGDTLVSDTALSGTFTAGFLQNSASPNTGSVLAATKTQFNFSNATPIQIDIIIGDVGSANNTITVQSGILEGL